jgi:hypothetical protein
MHSESRATPAEAWSLPAPKPAAVRVIWANRMPNFAEEF